MVMSATRAEAEGRRDGMEGRPIAALFTDLWRETTALVHDELELAKADLADKASQAGRGAGAVAAGGAVLFAGFLILLLAAVAALELALPPDVAPWLAPLLVGAVVAAVGAITLGSGRRKLQAERLKPTRALASLRRDGDVAKEHLQ
jgi:hypothetical protein